MLLPKVGRFLSAAAIGGTTAEDEDEDDEDGAAPPKETYTVVGTLSSADAAAPKWVKEVIPVREAAAVLRCAVLLPCSQQGFFEPFPCISAALLHRCGLAARRLSTAFVCLPSSVTRMPHSCSSSCGLLSTTRPRKNHCKTPCFRATQLFGISPLPANTHWTGAAGLSKVRFCLAVLASTRPGSRGQLASVSCASTQYNV